MVLGHEIAITLLPASSRQTTPTHLGRMGASVDQVLGAVVALRAPMAVQLGEPVLAVAQWRAAENCARAPQQVAVMVVWWFVGARCGAHTAR